MSIRFTDRSVNKRNDTRNITRMLSAALFASLALLAFPGSAQDKPYKEGAIWSVSFVKVKPGMFDVSLRDVGPMRKKVMDEAQRQGLILSYKMLSGSTANRNDGDIMVMEEYKNRAAFDGLTQKFEAIEAKLIGNEDKATQMMVKRTEVREIVGDKVLQELVLR